VGTEKGTFGVRSGITRRDVLGLLGRSTAAATAAILSPMATNAARAAGRTVTIGLGADINTLDPHMTNTFGTDLSVISHLYSSLIERGPDLKLHPKVATSWTLTGDTTWRFMLRGGIMFPNGEKLDAATVKWNFDRVLNPATQARVAPWFDLVSEVRVVGATVVEVATKKPYPAFEDQMAQFYLLAPRWTADHKPAQEAMGTGPYALKEWVKDDHIRLDAQPNYWGGGMSFQTVIFRPTPEGSSRVSGLLAGDLDVIVGVAPSDFGRINASRRARAGAVQSTRSVLLKFNTLKKPFDNRSVRQALNYAVDKDGLIKALLPGLTAPSTGEVLTPAYFGYNPDLKPYAYDPASAKRLLASAGVQGAEVEFDVPVGVYLLAEELSEAISEQFAQVGVQAKITEMPYSVFMDKYLRQHDMAQLMYVTFAWPTLDADGVLTLFEKGNQYAYWNNDAFSSLLDQARVTSDRAKRLALYKQATAVMREDAPALFLFPQPATYATANTVEWRARPDDWVRVWDMKPKT